MKHKLTALRYLAGALALNLALGLVCFAQQAAGSKSMIQGTAANQHTAHWIADWTRARAFTKEYLDAMPADGISLSPATGVRTFAEQMLHLAAANFAFSSIVTGVANPYQGKNLEKMDEFKKSKEALTKVVLESYDFMISSIPKLDQSKGSEKIKYFGQFEATRAEGFAKAFEHQTHHRGQTTIYLRLKGVTPPNEKLF
jgi:uncharacterized damage-inducible protein DinB